MKKEAHHIKLLGQNLWLWPQKAVFWQEKQMLLVTDLHLGKSGHFCSRGIPVPGEINETNLHTLSVLIESTSAHKLMILGDLFHSKINKEWSHFKHWRTSHPELEVTLIEGNHDILSQEDYRSANITVHEQYLIPPFMMIHDMQSSSADTARQYYILSGHIHPAIRLKGKGRQTVKLPCYYFGAQQGILPAFGTFTGTHVINPDIGDRVFAITNQEVVPL